MIVRSEIYVYIRIVSPMYIIIFENCFGFGHHLIDQYFLKEFCVGRTAWTLDVFRPANAQLVGTCHRSVPFMPVCQGRV